jgi:hypothetical protein
MLQKLVGVASCQSECTGDEDERDRHDTNVAMYERLKNKQYINMNVKTVV